MLQPHPHQLLPGNTQGPYPSVTNAVFTTMENAGRCIAQVATKRVIPHVTTDRSLNRTNSRITTTTITTPIMHGPVTLVMGVEELVISNMIAPKPTTKGHEDQEGY